MKTEYFEDEDTLVIRLSDKAVTRETSQDWYTHLSYAADGSTVEVVLLDAAKRGLMPVHIRHQAAA